MVLVEVHDKCGHQGSMQTYCLIKQQYYWKGMYKDIRKYIAQCALCHREKAKVQAYPLQMTEIPECPFNKIAIDLVTECEPPVQPTNTFLPSQTTSQDGQKHFQYLTNQLIQWYSLLSTCIFQFTCAPGTYCQIMVEFKNQLMDKVLQQFGIEHMFSAPYHPQSNPQISQTHLEETIQKGSDKLGQVYKPSSYQLRSDAKPCHSRNSILLSLWERP